MMSRCRDCPATALRDASGPTLGLTCAAGSCVKRHEQQHETKNIKRHGFQAVPAASGAGHVGPWIDRTVLFIIFKVIIYEFSIPKNTVFLLR